MNLDNKYKNELIEKYRTELFATEGVDIKELDGLINDEDLKAMISINNKEMINLINQNPINRELVRNLFVTNVNLYKLADVRELSIPGRGFLMAIATEVGYKADKLYSEFNVGAYYRPHRPR